ncbi:MAG: hypothetical protein JWN70_2734 [Planctomycetaceae bacterium]|nr:hypothetical protein [Planctomycetaceae bacterium]
MCAWFPNWPIQLRVGLRPELSHRALVLFVEAPRGLFVVACSDLAMIWGVRPGMPLAEARGLSTGVRGEVSSATGLVTELYEPATDRAALQVLALQCQTYSPLVALEESETPDSLLLDITGCDCHFGGEESLARQLWNDFSASRYHTRIAIADTVGAAWAMAHFGVEAKRPVAVIPAGQHSSTLRPLPVAGLRLSPRILETLHKLDLRVIGQLEKLPRSTLPSRFGKELLRRLDQAWGTVHELITPERLQEPLSAVWNFDEAIKDRRTLELVAQELLNKILAQLNPRQAGIRELRCDLRGTVDALTLTLRLLQSSLDQKHLWDLLRLEWDRREAAFRRSPPAAPRCFTDGMTSVRLEVSETAPLKIRQTTLFDLEPGQKEAVAFQHFVERLSSRLGSQSVVRPQPMPDAQPEYACEYPAWSASTVSLTPAIEEAWQAPLVRTRPFRLLAIPEPLRVLASAPAGIPHRIWWTDQQFQIVRAWGPERIETGWWREADIRRDYYRVETDHGHHLWIFRCLLTSHWFVHGTFE